MVMIMGYDYGLRYEHGYGNSYGPCYGYSAQGGWTTAKAALGYWRITRFTANPELKPRSIDQ